MAAYMSPEATEDFKNSMRSREIMASSFKRMFPNWDKMSEEQKAEALGKWEGQKSRKEMDAASIRSKAFTSALGSRGLSKFKA